MNGRYSKLSVGLLCKEAGVARSTFYLHFKNLEDVLISKTQPLFEDLVIGLCSPSRKNEALFVLEHLWEQRRHGELWRDPYICDAMERTCSDTLRRQNASAVEATYLSAGLISVLKQWTAGRISKTVPELYDSLSSLMQQRAMSAAL